MIPLYPDKFAIERKVLNTNPMLTNYYIENKYDLNFNVINVICIDKRSRQFLGIIPLNSQNLKMCFNLKPFYSKEELNQKINENNPGIFTTKSLGR